MAGNGPNHVAAPADGQGQTGPQHCSALPLCMWKLQGQPHSFSAVTLAALVLGVPASHRMTSTLELEFWKPGCSSKWAVGPMDLRGVLPCGRHAAGCIGKGDMQLNFLSCHLFSQVQFYPTSV